MSDYIKREDVLSVIREAFSNVDICPTADVVEVRHGRWEHDGSELKYRFLCSECGYKLMDVPTNYCPNCGAKMDEKEQENE